MPAAVMVCGRTTFMSATTILMHIASPFIIAGVKIHIRPWHNHRAAVTAVHVTQTSRQGRHQRDPKPNLDSFNQSVRHVHMDLPFAMGVFAFSAPEVFSNIG